MSQQYGILLYRQLLGQDKKILAGIFTGEKADEKCSAYEKEFEAILRKVSPSVSVAFWAIGAPDNPIATEDLVLGAIVSIAQKKEEKSSSESSRRRRNFRKRIIKTDKLTEEDWTKILQFTQGTRFHPLMSFFHKSGNASTLTMTLAHKGLLGKKSSAQFCDTLNQQLKTATSLPYAIRTSKKAKFWMDEEVKVFIVE